MLPQSGGATVSLSAHLYRRIEAVQPGARRSTQHLNVDYKDVRNPDQIRC